MNFSAHDIPIKAGIPENFRAFNMKTRFIVKPEETDRVIEK